MVGLDRGAIMIVRDALVWLVTATVIALTCALIAVVAIDITARLALNAPLVWGFEVTELLFRWLVFLALPLAASRTRWRQTPSGVVGRLLWVVLLSAVGVIASLKAQVSYELDARTPTLLGLPQIWLETALPTGCLLAVLVLLLGLLPPPVVRP
jgi:TRAP-type C4-dicarboxylate transport system permease small subunit